MSPADQARSASARWARALLPATTCRWCGWPLVESRDGLTCVRCDRDGTAAFELSTFAREGERGEAA